MEKELTFDALIEIPKGSRNKYEYDKDLKMMRFDRMIFSSMHYPADYGFIPDTLAEDGDPTDVLVLFSIPTFPGCVVEVRPVGVLNMADEKGQDSKVLCVPVTDPIWNKYTKLDEINDHLKAEIEHFFRVYKDLEKGKTVDIQGWADEKVAIQQIIADRERYAESSSVEA
ncbi:inorganic diphosphatase [Limibacter armeniacum]|uniref:inorganic diphosphatase n=1 Tax=Limibacter armeniacum TaxID=466084 RepID=UPI002FE55144